MDKPVARRVEPAHLICRTAWALVFTIGCAYFAYLSWVSLRNDDVVWQHQPWNIVTWAVWTALTAGLLSETRCWRERILFTLLLLIVVLGLVFSLWASAPFAVVKIARECVTAFWSLAAVFGLLAFIAPTGRISSKDV